MAQIACSYCGADNVPEAAYCTRCQRPLKSAHAPSQVSRPFVRSAEPSRRAPPPGAPPPRATAPAARITLPVDADLDGPTRVGPPPQFNPRRTPQPSARAAPTSVALSAQVPHARPTAQTPQSPHKPPSLRPNTADDADDSKTQISPNRLSPLMQRLTPKASTLASQSTAMLDLADAQLRQPPPAGPRLRRQAPVAPSVHDEKTVIGPKSTPAGAQALRPAAAALDALAQPAGTPAPHPDAAPKSAPTTPLATQGGIAPNAMATALPAETVIVKATSLHNVHSESTVIAPSPLGRPQALHQDPTVAERSPDDAVEPDYRLARPTGPMTPAPSRQAVSLPDEALGSETMVGARKLAAAPRLALAAAVDLGVIAASGWAWAATEMLLFDGVWPAERTGFEALALWLHMYSHTAVHAAALALVFTIAYTTLGAHGGRTLGRAALGLTLLRASGDNPTWAWALWHALATTAASLAWGAGLFWAVVDRRRRTFGNILSGSVICTD